LRRVREQAPLSAAACSSENLEFFQKFMDNGTSLIHNDAGIWALNIAAWGGNVVAVQILLEAGVYVAAGMPTDPSWTPVKLAAINGHESVVQLLERSGQENLVIDAVQG
jgi:ankyrin repeat protein